VTRAPIVSGRELQVNKEGRYSEGRELLVTRARTVSVLRDSEHHVSDHSITGYTRKELSVTKRDDTQKDRNCWYLELHRQ
jgi:hypothetical protein